MKWPLRRRLNMRKVVSRISYWGALAVLPAALLHDADARGKGSVGCVRSGNGDEHDVDARDAAAPVHQGRADGVEHVAASDDDGAGSAAVGDASEHEHRRGFGDVLECVGAVARARVESGANGCDVSEPICAVFAESAGQLRRAVQHLGDDRARMLFEGLQTARVIRATCCRTSSNGWPRST